MKHWEMRRRIAEFEGWTSIHESGRLDGQLVGYPPTPIIGKFEEIPGLTLDEIHEAAMFLRINRPIDYVHYAAEITSAVARCNSNGEADFSISAHDAPANIRAECLLKAVGDWEDS